MYMKHIIVSRVLLICIYTVSFFEVWFLIKNVTTYSKKRSGFVQDVPEHKHFLVSVEPAMLGDPSYQLQCVCVCGVCVCVCVCVCVRARVRMNL